MGILKVMFVYKQLQLLSSLLKKMWDILVPEVNTLQPIESIIYIYM